MKLARRTQVHWSCLVPVGLAGILLSWNLFEGSLLNSDDVIYTQMAREMREAARWLGPTWMGVELFEKPPLLFCLLGFSGELLGWNDGAMRLPSVLAGLIGLWYATRLALAGLSLAERDTKDCWMAASLVVAITLATVTFTMNSRRPITDPYLTAAILAALWYTLKLLRDGGFRASLGLGAAISLGVLAKSVAMGPVVVVSGIALIIARRFKGLMGASLVSLLLLIPWHLYQSLRFGTEFWDVYLGYHVGARATKAIVGHDDPGYYGTLLWELEGGLVVVMAAGLFWGLIEGWRRRESQAGQCLLLIVSTVALTAFLLQFSATRLFHYLMPLAPLSAVALVVVSMPWIRRSTIWLLAMVAVSMVFVAGPLEPHLTNPEYSKASKQVAKHHLAQLPADAEVVAWQRYDPALTWYANRPVRIWTSDPGFYALQQSVDMMQRTQSVIWANTQAMERLVSSSSPVVIVASLGRQRLLDSWIGKASSNRQVRVVEDTSIQRRIITLERR